MKQKFLPDISSGDIKKAAAAIIVLSLLVLYACQSPLTYRQSYKNYNELVYSRDTMHYMPFLKVHMKNGDLYIYDKGFKLDSAAQFISGEAEWFNLNRKPMGTFEGKLSIADAVLFETNTPQIHPEAGRITTLSIVYAIDIGLLAYCQFNPKACYGSCPTFYLPNHNNIHSADAEGFSHAIAPSMEYTDIDALYQYKCVGDTLSLHMKNEALETHCVNQVYLMAIPKKPDESVYHTTDNRFVRCSGQSSPLKAIADEGNILPLILQADQEERFSLSNPDNLSSKEEIIVDFGKTDYTQPALVLDYRQTLMTTYFIYSGIGYMGNEYSDYMARIERGAPYKLQLRHGIKKELGGIEVYTRNCENDVWKKEGEYYEIGPIALNRHLLTLNKHTAGQSLQVKLVLNKGLWRIDKIMLTQAREEVKPIEIFPCEVYKEGKKNKSFVQTLSDTVNYLVSKPGNDFELVFPMPNQGTCDVFLASRGYYLEWQRQGWLADKNPKLLRQMLLFPKQYLKKVSREYKSYESTMERTFWESKMDVKTYSHE